MRSAGRAYVPQRKSGFVPVPETRVTCLSIYTLEVYYRHMPLYRTGLFENAR